MGFDAQTTVMKQVRMIKPHHSYMGCGAPTSIITQVMVLEPKHRYTGHGALTNHHCCTGRDDQTSMLPWFLMLKPQSLNGSLA